MPLRNLTKNQIKSLIYFSSVLLFFFVVGQMVDLHFLNQEIEKSGMWAPFLYILIKISTVVLAPLSGTSLYIIAGPLFGIKLAIIYSVIGDIIGYSILFYLGRKYGLRIIKKIGGQDTLEITKIIVSKIKDTKSFLLTYITFFWFPEGITLAISLGNLNYKRFISTFLAFDILISVVIITISTILIL